jgi:hypothetical protein
VRPLERLLQRLRDVVALALADRESELLDLLGREPRRIEVFAPRLDGLAQASAQLALRGLRAAVDGQPAVA